MKRVALAAAISLATFMVAALLWRFRGGGHACSCCRWSRRPPFARSSRRWSRAWAGWWRWRWFMSRGWRCSSRWPMSSRRVSSASWTSPSSAWAPAYDQLRSRPRGAGSVHGFLLSRLPPAADLYRAVGGARPSTLLHEALGVTRNVIDLTGQFLILIALSAYWNASRESFERLWLSMAPGLGPPARARRLAGGRAGGWRAPSQRAGPKRALRAGAGGDVSLRRACPPRSCPRIAAGILRLVPFFGIPFAAALSYLAAASAGPGSRGAGRRDHASWSSCWPIVSLGAGCWPPPVPARR